MTELVFAPTKAELVSLAVVVRAKLTNTLTGHFIRYTLLLPELP